MTGIHGEGSGGEGGLAGQVGSVGGGVARAGGGVGGVGRGEGVAVGGGAASPPECVVVVVGVAVGVGRLQPGLPGAAGGHGGQLKLDEHHVVTQTHGQVERRLARQEVVNLEEAQVGKDRWW